MKYFNAVTEIFYLHWDSWLFGKFILETKLLHRNSSYNKFIFTSFVSKVIKQEYWMSWFALDKVKGGLVSKCTRFNF